MIDTSENDFTIKKTHRDWIVIRNDTQAHSHFKHKDGCDKLLQLVLKQVRPKNGYFLKAAQRILTVDEYERLKAIDKQTYINRRHK